MGEVSLVGGNQYVRFARRIWSVPSGLLPIAACPLHVAQAGREKQPRRGQSCGRKDDVGATLMVAPVRRTMRTRSTPGMTRFACEGQVVRKRGDHKRRPF